MADIIGWRSRRHLYPSQAFIDKHTKRLEHLAQSNPDIRHQLKKDRKAARKRRQDSG